MFKYVRPIFILFLLSYFSVKADLPKGYISTNFDKLLNTFSLNLDSDLNWETKIGSFGIKQRYRGIALQSGLNTIRDDQNFAFNSDIPLSKSFSFILKQNYINYNEKPSVNVNLFERINSLAGAKYKSQYFNFQVLAGAEKNNSLGLKSFGGIFHSDASIHNINLWGYQINNSIQSEYLKLNYDRTNSRFELNNSISKQYSENDILFANFAYKTLDMDYILAAYDPSAVRNFIVNRNIDSISAFVDISFELINDLLFKTQLFFDNKNTVNSFFERLSDGEQHKFYREINELNLTFNILGSYITNNFNLNFGLNIRGRDEKNLLRSNPIAPDEEFALLNRREKIRDNFSTILNFYIQPTIPLSSKDSISLNFTNSIQRYDTPHSENTSDNDVLRLLAGISYKRKFSPILFFNLNLDYQARHVVFLKAARSSLNNWNRVLRLAPKIMIITENFTMQPEFELLANYTVYDFQDMVTGLNSDSFRRISYIDKIWFQINRKIFLELNLNYKYHIRGILFWEDFTETPVENRIEHFTKIMSGYVFNDNFTIKLGGRAYGYKQSSMNRFPKRVNKYLSLAPELQILARFLSGSTITLSGWYEIQNINNSKQLNFMPNVFLVTRLNI